jgi:metal-dependent amidase/aminoacylase/carboxypeptidase family protein
VYPGGHEVVGKDQIDAIGLPSMGGEDFAAYLVTVPGCMFRLGVGGAQGTTDFLHSPRFDIDERAIPIGAKILARALVMLSDPRVRQGGESV